MNRPAFFAFSFVILVSFMLYTVNGSANLLNSSVAGQQTAVPLAYRAIVGIVLILICIFLFYKFFKYAIAGLFVIIVLLILLSTTYYFFKTGSFSITYSMKFLGDIYGFFTGSASSIVANAIPGNIPINITSASNTLA